VKILIINYEFPPLGGGAGNQTKLLSTEYAKMGHDVRIITSHYKGLPYCEKDGGVEIIRVPVLRKEKSEGNLVQMGLYLIQGCLPFINSCIRWKPDIVMSFFLLPTSVLAFIGKTLFRIPFIVSLRGGDVPSFVPREIKLYRYLKGFASMIGKKSSGLVAVSSDLAKMAKRDFPSLQQEISYIKNGYNVKNISNKKNRTPTFIFVGRLTKQKNLGFVFDGFKKVKGNYRLNIFGDGPEKERLEEIANCCELKDKVSFLGWVDKETIFKEMQKSHFLLLMSNIEGLSNSGLEAFANGLPIIASDADGVREFVTDNKTGFIIDASEKFVEKINQIIEKPQISEKMLKACQREIIENYSIRDSAKAYLDYFERIVCEH
jgi:glycosyltransferase involved in cell wall biosynthesis